MMDFWFSNYVSEEMKVEVKYVLISVAVEVSFGYVLKL